MELPQAPMNQRAIRCAAEKVYDGQSATVLKKVQSQKFVISRGIAWYTVRRLVELIAVLLCASVRDVTRS